MEVTIRHRGRGDDITFPLLEESGQPLLSVDYGKPNMEVYEEGGELQPRFVDESSSLEQYRIVSQLVGQDAYDDAILLADIIKSRTGTLDDVGQELTLQVNGNNLSDAYPLDEQVVAPAAEQQVALSLTYVPGRVNVVDVELTLTAVDRVKGTADQDANTPTDDGNGPLKLSQNRDTVEMFEDITVTRSVGRPNGTIRPKSAKLPNFTDHKKVANDEFEIDFKLLDDGPNKAATIARDMVQPRNGRNPLTLDFGGLFNMGAFSVVPLGSQALRVQRLSGVNGVEDVSKLALRRVVGL